MGNDSYSKIRVEVPAARETQSRLQPAEESKVIYGKPFGNAVSFDNFPAPEGTIFEAHTHPRFGEGFEWYGPSDLNTWQNEKNPNQYKVYGWNNVYTMSTDKLYTLSVPSTRSESAYGAWSQSNGINVGVPHGFNLYNSLFWLWH